MIDYTSLPVYKHKDQILQALSCNQVIIVESPTGSGKTTQIPLILNEAGYTEKGIIGITQPRRIAALSVSEFIKKQINDTQSFCGYTMRFHDTTDSTTRIKIMTDGIILQEVKADPLLSRYSVIMVDEAHERSLNIDFILGLLKEIIEKRPELKVIISSATINTKVFSDFFSSAPIVSISSHPFPVHISYIPIRLDKENEDKYYFEIEKLVLSAHKREDGGDVLIFLPGEAEIKTCINALTISSILNPKDYVIYPLYGRLSKEEQERVFIPTPEGATKVVVSTNVSETSLTIDGIRTVIDSGWAKTNYYNQRNFTSSLIPTLISKASADQRKGRAGRTNSGICYRLYSKEDYERRREFNEEEILHSDLAEVVLRMCELGIYNPTSFPFITKPKKESLLSAIETLKYIGAIEENLHLTSIGEMMIKFPLVPRLSRVIVEAIMNYPRVLERVLIAVSFLSTKSPFILPQGEEDIAREVQHILVDNPNGDFAAYLSLYYKYVDKKSEKSKTEFCKKLYLDKQTMDEIVHINSQLEEIVSLMGIPIANQSDSIKDYLICLASGLRQYICIKAQAYSYRSIKASEIYIHPGSSWFRTRPEFILAGEIVQTTKMYARSVSPLKADWIKSISPELLSALLSPIKNEKKVERKETKVIRTGELKKYEGRRKGLYYVPIIDLKKISDRCNNRMYLVCGSKVGVEEVKTKDIDGILSLIKEKKTPLKSKPKVHFNANSKSSTIKDQLNYLLSPYDTKKNFSYISLEENNGDYYLGVKSKIKDAIISSLYALSLLVEDIPKEEKELKRQIEGRIKAYERALDK